jgi:hypothetical protein
MNIDYDIFEILPDGSAMWRMCVRGLQSTTEALTGISKQASNECFAIELNTQSIIGRVNDVTRAAHVRTGEASDAIN